ncbi:MAG: YraN family protein [Acidimicrobiales bacterium]|nr:YraN family protein [Acidimicrobiales bacterium]
MTAARLRLGSRGEDRAAAWYRSNGYEILDRNWRCRDGELDLVCRRGGTLVFSEVKTRSSLAYGHPAEAVTPNKQRKVRQVARRWLGEREDSWRPEEIRFDVVAVLPGQVDVIEAAF